MDVSIMVEGQMGLTWPRWERLARAAEELGFYGLFRSDHFVGPSGPYEDALETWTSLAWLADNTNRISFGSLVSPISFRHPSILAWQASGADSLARGRLRLGLGAGWQAREHEAFGFDLIDDTGERFKRYEEGVQIIRSLTRSSEPISFQGDYYSLKDAKLRPRSPRSDGPPLVIGGNGPKRTLPLAAKYADEWNGLGLRPEEFREKCQILDELLEKEGREPGDVKRTMMTRGVAAADQAELEKKMTADDRNRISERGAVVGTPDQIVDILGRQAEAGIQGIMLQWLDLDDISGLEIIAEKILPQLK